ncbi:hypothetical protein ABBQ38_010781 [Trebouxia sp. C0009 RCD-2024]
MAKWHCKVCGHKWKATPNARVGRMKGCQQCYNISRSSKARIGHPTFTECSHPLLADWDHRRNAAQGHFPDNIRLRSQKQISWLCTKCPAGQEHSWSATPANRSWQQTINSRTVLVQQKTAKVLRVQERHVSIGPMPGPTQE